MFNKLIESLKEGLKAFDVSDSPASPLPKRPAGPPKSVPLKALRNVQKPIQNRALPGVDRFAAAKKSIGAPSGALGKPKLGEGLRGLRVELEGVMGAVGNIVGGVGKAVQGAGMALGSDDAKKAQAPAIHMQAPMIHVHVHHNPQSDGQTDAGEPDNDAGEPADTGADEAQPAESFRSMFGKLIGETKGILEGGGSRNSKPMRQSAAALRTSKTGSNNPLAYRVRMRAMADDPLANKLPIHSGGKTSFVKSIG